MRKTMTIFLMAAGAVIYSSNVLAQGGRGDHRGNMPGTNKEHGHSHAAENSNAPSTGTQMRGQERADERRNAEGRKREKSEDHQASRDHKGKPGMR